MAQSKKRRQSLSPERSPHPQGHKKRKISNAASEAIAGPSRPRVGRSPVPLSDSSATLDGDSSSSEKGKGKAVEMDPIMLELEQLRKDVAQQAELLENNKKTAAALLQSLSCHVCLETMCMPYALACGHMACQTCLVGWFTSTKNDHIDVENPGIDWLSDEESDAEGDGTNPGAGPVANGIHANVPLGHGNANQNLNGNGDVHQPAPALAPVLNALKRLKTCPHCRCIIKQRPIQIYPVKDVIGILVPSVEQESQASQASSKKDPKDMAVADPWKGIFPPVPEKNVKHSDNDAPLSEFGDNPPPPPPPLPLPPAEVDAEPFYDDLVPLGDLFPPPLPPPPPRQPPPPFIDEEDGVLRCGVCFHEIWGGACTNDRCDVDYGDESDESDEGDDGVDVIHGDPNLSHGDGDDESGHERHRSEAVDDDEEDGYESSFIDDGDNRQGLFRRLQRRFWPPRVEEGTSSDVEVIDDDDFIPGPSRRYAGGRQNLIVISSDDEEDSVTLMPYRVSRPQQIVVVDAEQEEMAEEEEQEVEGDVRSADERNFSSNDFVSEHQLTRPSVIHYIEEDDEHYGNEEVPYVWDEDVDAQDNVCLPDEAEDEEEDEEGYEA